MSQQQLPKLSKRQQAVETTARYEKLYAICIDDKRAAFHLKLYNNRSSFPALLVQKGELDAVEKRIQWQAGDTINYYYEDSDDTGGLEENNCILSAKILEICEDGLEAAEACVIRHSERLAEESAMFNKSHSSDRSTLEPSPENSGGNFDYGDRNNVIGQKLVSTPGSTRMRGRAPYSSETTGSKKRSSHSEDPEFVEDEGAGTRRRQKKSRITAEMESPTVFENDGDVSLSQLASLITAIDKRSQLSLSKLEKLEKQDKTLKALSDRVARLENAIKGGMTSALVANQQKSRRSLLNDKYAVKFVLESKILLIWMGDDFNDRIEAFLNANCSLDARNFARTLAVKMWGSRNLRYSKISIHDRASSRESIKRKDPGGFDLFRALVTTWNVGCTLQMSRQEMINQHLTEDEISRTLEKLQRQLEAEEEQQAASLFKAADQKGLDMNKDKNRVATSWYWELLDAGKCPHPDWTIFDEYIANELKDWTRDRANGVKNLGDDRSTTVKRIRTFQETYPAKESIDVTKFDRFGVALDS